MPVLDPPHPHLYYQGQVPLPLQASGSALRLPTHLTAHLGFPWTSVDGRSGLCLLICLVPSDGELRLVPAQPVLVPGAGPGTELARGAQLLPQPR